jgi:hypothetical protein
MTFVFMLIIWAAVCLLRAGMLRDFLITVAVIGTLLVLFMTVYESRYEATHPPYTINKSTKDHK